MSSEKTFTLGTCYYERISPPRENITPATSILNINLDLEQALKLDLALNECIRKINKYKENSETGKRALVNLSIHLWAERISVNEAKLPRGIKKKRNRN